LPLAGVVFWFAGRGMACHALICWGYFPGGLYVLTVSAGFVKSAGAIFHPVWEQQEGSGCLPLCSLRQM